MAPGINWQNVLTPEDLSATGGEVKRANACNGCRKARSKCIRQGRSTTSTQSCARCKHLDIACSFNSARGPARS
ncbi:hypothetical protein PNOK_0583700 [Pyrrhoderma noxium]|uniref:Zn(2)-C6 fungal-type domain-containing protein n=1 Tax=Pyrrhoderma noxium TaxID=2282107 RepID=A0A286UHC4_9AGAM|nr:hypothetical protein PNOK_0583700 [Pyrrhoderma noxium]